MTSLNFCENKIQGGLVARQLYFTLQFSLMKTLRPVNFLPNVWKHLVLLSPDFHKYAIRVSFCYVVYILAGTKLLFFCTICALVSVFLIQIFYPSNILISKVPFEFEGTNMSYSHFPLIISLSRVFFVVSLFCSGSSLLHVCFFCRFTALKSVLSIRLRLSIADPVSAAPQRYLYCTWIPGTQLRPC